MKNIPPNVAELSQRINGRPHFDRVVKILVRMAQMSSDQQDILIGKAEEIRAAREEARA